MPTREFQFNNGAPPPGQWLELLCEDRNGTYVLPFLCQSRNGVWHNPKGLAPDRLSMQPWWVGECLKDTTHGNGENLFKWQKHKRIY